MPICSIETRKSNFQLPATSFQVFGDQGRGDGLGIARKRRFFLAVVALDLVHFAGRTGEFASESVHFQVIK
jgi:hypothetical protein